MGTTLRRPLVLIPLLLALLFGVYLAAGFWLVPRVVRSQADAYVAKNLPGKQVTMGEVRFNPLRLALEIDNLAVADAKAPTVPLLAARHLLVDASVSSLWHLYPRLDVVAVDAPLVNAVLRGDGSLNLKELVPPDDGKPMPSLWIGNLNVASGVANFTDQRGAAPRQKSLTPISFSLRDFATTETSGGGFKFDATSDEGEGLHWAGKLAMAPLSSSGKFSVEALKLTSLYRFVADTLPVAVTNGSLNLVGSYTFAVPPTTAGKAGKTQFEATVDSLTVADLGIRTADGDNVAIKSVTVAPTQVSMGQDSATLGAVNVAGITATRGKGESVTVDAVSLAPTRYALTAQTADVGALGVTGIAVKGRGKGGETVLLSGVMVGPSQLDMAARRAAIGAVALSGLKARALVAADNSVSVPGLYPLDLPKSKPSPGPAWQYGVESLALDDAAVHLTLARAKPAGEIDLAPMTLRVGALSSASAAPLPIEFKTVINHKASFAAIGRVDPKTNAAAMAIDLAGLQLKDFIALAPELPPGIDLQSGVLGVNGQLAVKAANGAPQIEFAGDASVADLAIAEKFDSRELVSWARLDVTGIHYRPAGLAIARVTFDRPISHVSISREAEFNVVKVSGDSPAPVAAGAGPLGGKLKIGAPISTGIASAGRMIPITIGAVVFKGGTISFADYSVEPNFAAKIQAFNGSITGLSTAPNSQAKFDLKGYVIDRFSPVTITGRANPFAYDANTDVTVKFANIELPVFNPYSGKWAGYSIAKGKLSTELHYQINHRQLEAAHHVKIDQLEWGNATDSKDKVSLPVRFATSLLKDKDGVIDLDLPVTGTLDDPKFKIWPVVWHVVGTLFTKIITAPFAMIGAMFEGADKAQFVVFAPGSATLPPDAGKNLSALAKGLAGKPEVKLDIPAGPAIKEDAEAMTTQAIEAAVLASKKGGADYAALDPGKKLDGLKAVYKAKFGHKPDFPKDLPSANLISSKEVKAAAADAETKWLETELRAKMAPTDAELAALGQARADAVKQALLADNAIDPARVFVATGASVTAKDKDVQMELKAK